jgi:RNA polymerase sigma-70 factor (ECF subfamily)
MRRLFDSMDICQSVFGSFFVRASAGQYELDRPEQLLKLLGAMARNKLIKQAEKQRAARRDIHRQQHDSFAEEQLVAAGPSPSSAVAHQELLREFRNRLSDEERQIADHRAMGRAWSEIATAVGSSPDAVRMQLNRAIDRVSQELGLEV